MEQIIIKNKWVAGVSDGLTLPCRKCGLIPNFDFGVDSIFWKQVVPEEWRLDVVCLHCLDKLATKKGLDVTTHIETVQFTGIGKTIILNPSKVFYYKR